MDHKLLEAKTATTTDAGEFTAIAAAYSLDRVGERILPGAFAGTIKAWQESGKQIPLHWNHSGDAADIIGTVDPASMKETKDGLEVSGKLDLTDSTVAREAWRSIKADRVGLSFGYMVEEETEAEDGIRLLKRLDVFEITITPAPANTDTRFLALKALELETNSSNAVADVNLPESATASNVEDRTDEESQADQVSRQDTPLNPLRARILRSRFRRW